MSSSKPGDSKREEFRKYLEKAGVLHTLTKVLVGLYEEPEKPSDAIEYLKLQLAVNNPDALELESLKQEVDELKSKLMELSEENKYLKQLVQQHDPSIEVKSVSEA